MSTESHNPVPNRPMIQDITAGIEKVVKSPPVKTGETGTFHIFIWGREITLTTAQLKTISVFENAIIDTFLIVPIIMKDEWSRFRQYIVSIAEEGDIEETTAVMAADIIFEEICTSFDVTEEKELLLDRDQCKSMVLHQPHDKPYFVVPAGAVSGLINECGIKSTSRDVADAMRARGYINGNTRPVRVTGVNVRCWWLLPDAIKAQGIDLPDLRGIKCQL